MSAPVKIHVKMADSVLIIMEVTLVVVEKASREQTVKKVHSLIVQFENVFSEACLYVTLKTITM